MTGGEWFFTGGTALGLGLLTAWSPCPLLSNLAAMSYILREGRRPRDLFVSGSAYMAGRMATYAALAAVLSAGILSMPLISYFLQKYLNQMLGPVLVFSGMVLLEWMPLPAFPAFTPKAQWARGIAGPAFWGALFALSFCPVSAALFFGSLIPLCVKVRSFFWLPVLYGLGTGLPVALFAFLTALGVKRAGAWFEKTAKAEKFLRWAAGYVFLLVGVYFCLVHLFGIPLGF